MKRFLKALPIVLVGGLALTGCSVTEQPATTSGFSMEYSSHTEGDALGSTAANGTNVLGFQAVTAASQLTQLGLNAGAVKVDSGGDKAKQHSELKISDIASDSLNQVTSNNAQQLQALFQQWQGGDTSKTVEAFFASSEISTMLQGYPGVTVGTLLPSVTEENGEHTLTFAPLLAKTMAAHNVQVTVTAPGPLSLEKEIEGVSVSGREITIDTAKLSKTENFKVTYHEAEAMMTWWLSAGLWILGVIVTVLLIAIALAPRRRD